MNLTILYEYVHEPRIIPLDNSAHPKNYWAWDGDSRGRWEGDTLVVDVTNFNGRTWLDMTGNFVDENLHVVERYTLKDANTIPTKPRSMTPPSFPNRGKSNLMSNGSRNRNNCWNTVAWKGKVTVSTTPRTRAA